MTTTVVDMWRLLADHESRTVVMLDDSDVADDVRTQPLVSPPVGETVSRNIQGTARKQFYLTKEAVSCSCL